MLSHALLEGHEFLFADALCDVLDVRNDALSVSGTLYLVSTGRMTCPEAGLTEVEHLAMAEAKLAIGFVGFFAIDDIAC